MSIDINKNCFSNKDIISKYNEYKKKSDEYCFKKADIENIVNDLENKIENQKNLKSKINKIAIGIIISGSLIGVASAITASVIVIGGALAAFVLSGVLIAVLIASFVFLLVATVSFIVSICLFAKKPSKKISKYEKEILTPQNSLRDLEEQNPLKDLKKPFLPMPGNRPVFGFEITKAFKENEPSGGEYWEEVYSAVKRLYEDIFDIKKEKAEEKKKNDIKLFNQFRKYFFAHKFFMRGGILPIIRNDYLDRVYGRENKVNFCEEFFKNVSEIINSNKTNEEKIELIECHPLITITKCLQELYYDYAMISEILQKCYLGVFDKYVDRFKNDSEFYNLFVIKMFEKITKRAFFDIKKTAENVVAHIGSQEQMNDILAKTALIKNEEPVDECSYKFVSTKGTFPMRGRYIKAPKILKDEIIQELKKAWQEKTNQ